MTRLRPVLTCRATPLPLLLPRHAPMPAPAADPTARNALAMANAGLAYRCALVLGNAGGMTLRIGTEADVEQECLAALLVAAERFDPQHRVHGRPGKFSTYDTRV